MYNHARRLLETHWHAGNHPSHSSIVTVTLRWLSESSGSWQYATVVYTKAHHDGIFIRCGNHDGHSANFHAIKLLLCSQAGHLPSLTKSLQVARLISRKQDGLSRMSWSLGLKDPSHIWARKLQNMWFVIPCIRVHYISSEVGILGELLVLSTNIFMMECLSKVCTPCLLDESLVKYSLDVPSRCWLMVVRWP